MVKLTPVMGWNAWNWFGGNVSEQLLCEIADAMVSSGLADCGYEYILSLIHISLSMTAGL